MDASRIDQIARILGAADSRRRALRLLAGAAVIVGAGGAPARLAARRRCHREGHPCTHAKRCCSGLCDSLIDGGTCGPCMGQFCSPRFPCCGGLPCIDNACGGCHLRATVCTADDQCCFSDCGSHGSCLSDRGGRCVHDVDCVACFAFHDCANACVNGVCTV